MCGRYSLTNPQRILEAFPQFRFAEFSELRVPRYNIAPTQSVLGVRSGSVAIEGMRWGLLPPFAPQTPRITGLINARAETVASKPSFRDAFRHRR
jgi:putative SOS response-associated peptidase YedK